MAIITTDGILLRKMELRETSLMLNFFTRESGKIVGVLKGARSPHPQFGSVYEVFSLDRLVFYEKKNKDVFVISQCELLEYFLPMRGDLDRTACAYYLAELVDFTSQIGQKNTNVFDLLRGSYALLCQDLSYRRVARIFEIKLLKELGIMPQVESCVICGDKQVFEHARFGITSGGIFCQKCAKNEGHTIPLLAGTARFIGSVLEMPLDKVYRLKVSEDVGRELEKVMRQFINFHIQKRFKSVEFIEQIGAK